MKWAAAEELAPILTQAALVAATSALEQEAAAFEEAEARWPVDLPVSPAGAAQRCAVPAPVRIADAANLAGQAVERIEAAAPAKECRLGGQCEV